jgi:pyruvate/2-oxoglutarate dehydrogenase complex dihydrolipoamide acyltransferase (E2) component
VEIKIPKLGVSMTEGSLVEWLVRDGAEVARGTPIYRLETDKVENDIEAPEPGRITLIRPAGETYEVGTTIAEILTCRDLSD